MRGSQETGVTRVACIGECMIELSEMPDGRLARSFGGDTLNTAVYMARLGAAVDYVTALGDDDWSGEMLAAWQGEGIGTSLVARLPSRLPGLYIIQTDRSGERRFRYWRDSAPARDVFELPQTDALVEALAGFGLLFFSGITLSIYQGPGRAGFFKALETARARGARIAFDTNFRPRGWPDRSAAHAAFSRAVSLADIVLASTEDLELLYGDAAGAGKLFQTPPAELVCKSPDLTCRVVTRDGLDEVVAGTPAERVVDTTAAGDSFAAAYLASRLRGLDPVAAAKAGHALAGVVVGYPGALIPRSAMPASLLPV
jgi:2-dehydro-3-deoxygluconokinase